MSVSKIPAANHEMMPKEFNRDRRVAELLLRELAILVQRFTQDTEMGLVTLSNINVSPDLKNAKIYITCLGNTVNKNEIVNSLNEHTGHFRHELTRMVSLKFIPKLQFEFDTSLEKANRLTNLIESLHLDGTDKEKKI